MDEGYIKFNCNWIKTNIIPEDKAVAINVWRDIMYKKGLIGVYDDGIGFGNISARCEDQTFLITGSSTGEFEKLNETHYSLVTNYNLLQNSLTCKGPIKASSESLTHALIYECSPETNAVIHIHNIDMWNNLIHKVPTTKIEATYGTPEIANEIKRLFSESTVAAEKIIVMGGHKEGIISFGRTLEEAGNILLKRL